MSQFLCEILGSYICVQSASPFSSQSQAFGSVAEDNACFSLSDSPSVDYEHLVQGGVASDVLGLLLLMRNHYYISHGKGSRDTSILSDSVEPLCHCVG